MNPWKLKYHTLVRTKYLCACLLIFRDCFLLNSWQRSVAFGYTILNHLNCQKGNSVIFLSCYTKYKWREMLLTNTMHKQQSFTFIISGSFHGPLSERIQPPLSAQVQVPPKNSGSSLVQENKGLVKKFWEKNILL